MSQLHQQSGQQIDMILIKPLELIHMYLVQIWLLSLTVLQLKHNTCLTKERETIKRMHFGRSDATSMSSTQFTSCYWTAINALLCLFGPHETFFFALRHFTVKCLHISANPHPNKEDIQRTYICLLSSLTPLDDDRLKREKSKSGYTSYWMWWISLKARLLLPEWK